MTFFLFIPVGFLIIVLQSALFNQLPMFLGIYDLLIPYVIFLGFNRPANETIPLILLFGFIQDSISAGPFGIYITTYLWITFGIFWLVQFLHAGGIVLFPVFVVIGILIETVIFLGTSAIVIPEFAIYPETVTVLILQVAWAILTAPFILVLLRWAVVKFKSEPSESTGEKNGK